MAVHIEAGKCDGYASCVVVAPAIFGFDDDNNVAIVLDSYADASDPAAVDEAMQNCPRRAISRG